MKHRSKFRTALRGAGSAERICGLRPGLVALALYLIASLVLIGRPVLDHLGSDAIAYGPDPPLFIWDLKWWPQAIVDGLNPLVASVAYAPEGFPTPLITSIAGPSLVMAPVTQIFGPFVSYNVLMIAIPAINGYAAFLLCRTAGGKALPSIVGGYVFGFSSYVLGQSLGHPNLSLVAMAPLAVYLVLRHQRQTISRARFLIAMSAVLTFQFLTFTEVFLTLTTVGVAVYGLALLLFPPRRRSLLVTARLLLIAYAITGLLVSPYLVATLGSDLNLSHISPIYYSADPLNLVIPTRISVGGSALYSVSARFTGNLAENGAYFGIPMLLVLGIFTWQRRRDRVTMLLIGAFAIALIAAMGPRLNLLGTASPLRLPWTLLFHLPLFKYALPERIVVYAWLALALVVALWLSTPSRRQWAKWTLVGVGLVSILPDPAATDPVPPTNGASIWSTHRLLPPFFRSGDRALFAGRPNLLVLPYNEAGNGNNLYWQASTGMAYKMPGGYVSGTVPDEFNCWPLVTRLRGEEYRREDRGELLAFLAAKHVDGVVAPTPVARAAAPLLGALGERQAHIGGVTVFRVPPRPQSTSCPDEGA